MKSQLLVQTVKKQDGGPQKEAGFVFQSSIFRGKDVGFREGITRWWQLKDFLFSPRNLGKSSNLTNLFFSNGLKPPTRKNMTISLTSSEIAKRTMVDHKFLKFKNPLR